MDIFRTCPLPGIKLADIKIGMRVMLVHKGKPLLEATILDIDTDKQTILVHQHFHGWGELDRTWHWADVSLAPYPSGMWNGYNYLKVVE